MKHSPVLQRRLYDIMKQQRRERRSSAMIFLCAVTIAIIAWSAGYYTGSTDAYVHNYSQQVLSGK